VMMSAADREPPGCPLPAVAVMVITWRRNVLAISPSSATEKSNMLASGVLSEDSLMWFSMNCRLNCKPAIAPMSTVLAVNIFKVLY